MPFVRGGTNKAARCTSRFGQPLKIAGLSRREKRRRACRRHRELRAPAESNRPRLLAWATGGGYIALIVFCRE
jgi:hypothetical protein